MHVVAAFASRQVPDIYQRLDLVKVTESYGEKAPALQM